MFRVPGHALRHNHRISHRLRAGNNWLILSFRIGNFRMKPPFHSIYSHGFIRAAVCIPFLRVADPGFNVERTLGLARRASELSAAVALFPELGISAYSNEDL